MNSHNSLADFLKGSSKEDYKHLLTPYCEQNRIQENFYNIREFEMTQKIPLYVFGISCGQFAFIAEDTNVEK